MEPSAQDIAAVAAAMGGQPAPTQPVQPTQPQAQPTQPQQQPAQPTPQQTPSQQPTQPTDPFAELFSQPQQQPTQPTQPAQPTQQASEPFQAPQAQQVQPVAQPQVQPVQPVQPEAPQTQTYEQYIESVLKGLPEAPAQPDPTKVDPNSEEAIGKFFTDLMTTAEQRFEANYARKMAIQNSERQLWDDAFSKYASLKENPQLRDMVHAIRMAEFKKGFALTPAQAADRLVGALRNQYQKGVADNQVVTTIEQTQPNGGNGTSVTTTMDSDKALLAVQTGGETALAQILDAQFRQQGN